MSSTSSKKDASDKIREQVTNRHWQLFEMRLKSSSSETTRKNYTRSNDYRIIDRLKPNDSPQLPIEPTQRWQRFCSEVTPKSNETDRVMSIFHHVWMKNWNVISKESTNSVTANENNCFKYLAPNDREKKILSSILHRTI